MKNCFLIINYNDYKYTKQLIDNVIDYKCLDYILIVDNNSNKEEKALLRKIKHKKVEILYNDDNFGYSTGINVGSKYLIDKYGECNLIISNSDIVISCENDLITMLDLLNNKTIGLVGPQIMELGRVSRGYKYIKPFTDIRLSMPLFRRFVSSKKYLYNDKHYEEEVAIVDVISSAFFLISSDTLQRINFFDENVFLYYEDFILAKKVRNLNLLVVVANNIKVQHLNTIDISKEDMPSKNYKFLKDSQLYFQTMYNNANKVESTILKIIAKLGYNKRIIKEKRHKN